MVDILNIGKILFSNFSYGFPYPVTLISENSRVFKHAINQRLFKWGEEISVNNYLRLMTTENMFSEQLCERPGSIF